jgi:sirohydrochlorin cobaltochelatase
MPTQTAYILVSHGSPDPRPAIAAAQVAQWVSDRLDSAWVKTAVLECAPQPLHQQIQEIAQAAIAQDFRHLQLVPLFLLPGVHVMEDIPAEVAIAQQHLPHLPLTVCPYLGTDLTLHQLLPEATTPAILMSHGSRRKGGNAPIEAIALQRQALPAFWSVEPKLESQVAVLAAQGHQEITVLPYFLFEGGIIDAIAQHMHQLSQQHDVSLRFTPLLGHNPELAEHIVNLIA